MPSNGDDGECVGAAKFKPYHSAIESIVESSSIDGTVLNQNQMAPWPDRWHLCEARARGNPSMSGSFAKAHLDIAVQQMQRCARFIYPPSRWSSELCDVALGLAWFWLGTGNIFALSV